MRLTSENVENIFIDCLFNEGDDTSMTKIVDGITSKFGFDPEKLENHSVDVADMLSQLPIEFQKDDGGGMSFLNACNDSSGDQWTGMHSTMEKLFVLGMACDKVKCLLPRQMWISLPGGVPYYVVL